MTRSPGVLSASPVSQVSPARTASLNEQPIEVVSGLAALAGRYDLVLCDVWGVLHDGVKAFPPAGDALTRYRSGGGCVVLVSNAPRPGAEVGRQLDGLGVPRTAYDTIVTSGDITRTAIAERAGRAVYHLGPERDASLFRGLDAPLVDLRDAEYVVCTGLFHDEQETVASYDDALRAMRERDLLFVSANPDIVVERGHLLIPCAGALAAAYEAIGGRTFTGGKPHRPIYEAALEAAAGLGRGRADPDRTVAIGDAIRTDVAGAREFGIDALMIARGIHAAELGVRDGRLDEETALAWLAGQRHRPTSLAAELVWDRQFP